MYKKFKTHAQSKVAVAVIAIVLTGLFACVNLGNEFIVQWSNVLLDSNPEGNGR